MKGRVQVPGGVDPVFALNTWDWLAQAGNLHFLPRRGLSLFCMAECQSSKCTPHYEAPKRNEKPAPRSTRCVREKLTWWTDSVCLFVCLFLIIPYHYQPKQHCSHWGFLNFWCSLLWFLMLLSGRWGECRRNFLKRLTLSLCVCVCSCMWRYPYCPEDMPGPPELKVQVVVNPLM